VSLFIEGLAHGNLNSLWLAPLVLLNYPFGWLEARALSGNERWAAAARSIVRADNALHFRCEAISSFAETEERMDRRAHWEHVYRTKSADRVSWFQSEATLSRQIVERFVPARSTRIVDIGGGASTLVDGLLAGGYRSLTVVDLSEAALALAQRRLGDSGSIVTWLAEDVLTIPFASGSFDVWHDRAVFHFLTAAADRARYVEQVRHAVRPGGHVLVATFADDGPDRCSGLEVARYSANALHREFGAGFRLIESHREVHTTPFGTEQAFTYCLCVRDPLN